MADPNRMHQVGDAPWFLALGGRFSTLFRELSKPSMIFFRVSFGSMISSTTWALQLKAAYAGWCTDSHDPSRALGTVRHFRMPVLLILARGR